MSAGEGPPEVPRTGNARGRPGEEYWSWLRNHQAVIRRASGTGYAPPSHPSCKCGQVLELKDSKRGKIWGCPQSKKCPKGGWVQDAVPVALADPTAVPPVLERAGAGGSPAAQAELVRKCPECGWDQDSDEEGPLLCTSCNPNPNAPDSDADLGSTLRPVPKMPAGVAAAAVGAA